ncbi:hypothetical protein CLF_105799 [Clonorchis sinensis]|uniref:Uncharacterized protein n=1 Tax=Clonorchis sinensis TaxID=79923 RepID=G7YE80_CLOSI|nr:hypothetical protein CLF_105799 [Clonorchis sinensis]
MQSNTHSVLRYERAHYKCSKRSAKTNEKSRNLKQLCLHMSFSRGSANAFAVKGENGSEDTTRIDAREDWGTRLLSNISVPLHLEKSAQKAFAVLRMIRRTFSGVIRVDFQIPYGAHVRPLLEYAKPVVYSGCTKDVVLIKRVQRAATKIVAGLKSVDYEMRPSVFDLSLQGYCRLQGDLMITYPV